MLPVSVTFLAFLFSFLLVGVGLFVWFRQERKDTGAGRGLKGGRESFQCPVCGNVYAAIPRYGMTVCPLCESINSADDEPRRKHRRPNPKGKGKRRSN